MTVTDDRPAPALGTVYPTDWDSLIGQELAKRQLRIACQSARKRKAVLEHVLLASGEHGIGKTALALLVAQEIGTGFHAVSGALDLASARNTLADCEDGDVLLWDEFHQAVVGGKAKAEWLLNYMQDGVLLSPTGVEETARVTIVAATTDKGRVPETILSRFLIQPEIASYTDEEATLIALSMGPKIFTGGLPLPNADNARDIASAACNNPRAIRKILVNVRDIAVAEDLANYSGAGCYDIGGALELMGMTRDGLDRLARRYLIALKTKFPKAGERALMDALQEPGGLGPVERVLLKKDLIYKTPGGRCLSSKGAKRAAELVKAGETM